MNHTDQMVSTFEVSLKERYGYVADECKPLWDNIERCIGMMDIAEWSARPRNMACHNLLLHNKIPAGTTQLLGLGLNFCIKSPTTTETTHKTFDRLTEDVRRIYALRDVEKDDTNYIPQLYIKSDYRFQPASTELESALTKFKKAVLNTQQQLRNRRFKPHRNITHSNWNLIQQLRKNDTYIVVHGDKNLGPCIIDRKHYIWKGCMEHLGNTTNYMELSQEGAFNRNRGLQIIMRNFLTKFRPRDKDEKPAEHTCISHGEEIFLRRAMRREPEKLARFRMTAKVHKSPWKMRPIVCCAGTMMNDWSKWLDYWLQKLKPSIPTFIKDGQQVLNEIELLQLPPNAKLFTADANSMYNNIDTEHAIRVIEWWLKKLDQNKQLPPDFPLEAVTYAMKTIMRNHIFEWGDLFFLQLLGTAMGTSSAVMWATLYYAYHEVHTLIPNHGHNLLYFKRFIDDIFGIWIGNATTEWTSFCDDVDDYGILTWDIKQQKLSKTVHFLDLTLTINNRTIISKTYQKTMNLYLYLPFASAHPQGCIKGTIYGLINRYYAQNTYRKDYANIVRLLYHRICERGWDSQYIHDLIINASRHVETKSTTQQQQATLQQQNETERDDIFIHLQYHPDDISRRQLRRIYEDHLAVPLKREIDINRAVVAYSKPKNIGDYVTQAKLHQAPGETASIIMGEYKQDQIL